MAVLARRVLSVVIVVAVLAGLWEGYRAMGRATDDEWPLIGVELPVGTDDRTMPSVSDITSRLFEAQQARGGSDTVAVAVVKASWFTFREAIVGFVAGLVVGLALAILMLRWRVVERGLLPWVIVSQTIPLLALAPVVVAWAGRLSFIEDRRWLAVSIIATYLTFFPVAVNGLRGLKAPARQSIELMSSYAATWRQTLVKVRLPAAAPYLVPALKLAATASIVGAIVGEISTGIEGGIGRLIISYAQQAQTDPPKLYGAILGAALLGLVFVGLIGLLDRLLPTARARPGEIQ
jgi:NitT/TauT family transport system permease protein